MLHIFLELKISVGFCLQWDIFSNQIRLGQCSLAGNETEPDPSLLVEHVHLIQFSAFQEYIAVLQ